MASSGQADTEEDASPRTKPSKDHNDTHTPDAISPMLLGQSKPTSPEDGPAELESPTLSAASPRRYRASISSKRLTGRYSDDRLQQYSRHAFGEAASGMLSDDFFPLSPTGSQSSPTHHGSAGEGRANVIAQISTWIRTEKSRRAARKERRRKPGNWTDEAGGTGAAMVSSPLRSSLADQLDGSNENADEEGHESDSSEGSTALEQLERIVKKSLKIEPRKSFSKSVHRRLSSARKFSRRDTLSSDEEYSELDHTVPTCDVVLDNSKAMGYGGGGATDADDERETEGEGLRRRKSVVKEKQAWSTFKYETVRLAHTLRLKGWRRVPMDRSDEIEISRLSGALTNAVYVVTPPHTLPPRRKQTDEMSTSTASLVTTKPPQKLLLRIYGPNVSHLIDREAELQILKRLSRKNIGPRLLGTFANGRFEEFLYARPLTPEDLRSPETSTAIAKRMKELHEGIELLPKEIEAGPFVWSNWEKWVDRCERIVGWLDERVREWRAGQTNKEVSVGGARWMDSGFVCGTEWKDFRKTLEKYRGWLEEQYGGPKKINERLVFSHNDTQYGNILRLEPSGESPLLHPANQHKQLVVIDFEYASANLPGLEFANHFTEWCYNYHDEDKPHVIATVRYPDPAEQRRFVRAYLQHRYHSSALPTPTMSPVPGAQTPASPRSIPQTPPTPRPTGREQPHSTSSSISTLMLDSRGAPAPPLVNTQSARGDDQADAHRRHHGSEGHEQTPEAELETETERLLSETRLWRLANSAQWVAWGVVQAKVAGMPPSVFDGEGDENASAASTERGEPTAAPAKAESKSDESDEDEEEEEFDYLAYARSRALFFWGDAVNLGMVQLDELPDDVREEIKLVKY